MHSKVIVGIVIVLLGLVEFSVANKAKTCYTCEGINCMRTSLSATKTCSNPLDYCVTIFDKCKFKLLILMAMKIKPRFQSLVNIVQKGCSYEVPENLRKRCDANTVECHKCNSDRCNNLGQIQFTCIQCDSSQVSYQLLTNLLKFLKTSLTG